VSETIRKKDITVELKDGSGLSGTGEILIKQREETIAHIFANIDYEPGADLDLYSCVKFAVV